jgi:hypothetical protein
MHKCTVRPCSALPFYCSFWYCPSTYWRLANHWQQAIQSQSGFANHLHTQNKHVHFYIKTKKQQKHSTATRRYAVLEVLICQRTVRWRPGCKWSPRPSRTATASARSPASSSPPPVATLPTAPPGLPLPASGPPRTWTSSPPVRPGLCDLYHHLNLLPVIIAV